jgi:TonB family protein
VKCHPATAFLTVVGLALSLVCQSQEQAATNAVLVDLAQPKYPPLAQQANVTGDVLLALTVSPGGSVQSANVISGHPLFKQAALDSALHSKFDCSSCNGSSQYRLLYTFKLNATDNCCEAGHDITVTREPESRIAGITQTHVILAGEQICICDPASTITRRVRSLKCLYLWKCSTVTR